ncbi:hypothetical protein [Mesorhizobium sp. M7A.F.Ca.US.008.03.1.1]|uniref:hypothetical protein n=1 Tax=Mesorhizobium sp. M7A.F.Ca.US.008.03.1.1 TaxID=2496742 RepID=UPI0013E0CF31|nr:hypothetical protein [Mesorhizobium sp. M7A.F.Ca.US.008.03.1.1]
MTRYATIITDADGQEIVSAIGEFEGLGRGHAWGVSSRSRPALLTTSGSGPEEFFCGVSPSKRRGER